MEEKIIEEYSGLILFVLGSFVLVMGGYITSALLSPDRPNEEKLTTYESGEDPTGSAWGNFNIRFYIVAIIFILFEVEIAFLFPWATIFGDEQLIQETQGLWGWFALIEAFLFVAILGIGLAYVWRKGFLDWIKPEVKPSKSNNPVPKSVYDQFNNKVS